MMKLSEVAQAVCGELSGSDRDIGGVSIDGRNMPVNGLFVALKGDRVDGHDFIEQAANNGAVAALVEHSVSVDLPVVKVDSVRRALADLASYWRDKFLGKLVAVTGSNGKTTVKEMLSSILGQCGATLATKGNFNNDLGVPLTLLRINPQEHKYAVIEMGANHVGEIKQLCEIAKPDVSLINNVGKAHLEGFGSIEDVVRAKSEIYSGLKPNGTAIVNGDDQYRTAFLANAEPHKCVIFSSAASADVVGKLMGVSPNGFLQIELSTKEDCIEVNLPLLGKHSLMNALAAATTALEAGATLSDVKKGLECVKPVPGRLNPKQGLAGTLVIDDTYNANPSSCSVAINALALFDRKKVLVLGDMGELGDGAQSLHREVGEYAQKQGVDRIFTLGELSESAAEKFVAENAFSFSRYEDLEAELKSQIEQGLLNDAAILVKGSRFMKMERVVSALTDACVDLNKRNLC